MSQSCYNCVNRVPAKNFVSKTGAGKSMGVDVCQAKGELISFPALPVGGRKHVETVKAEGCKFFSTTKEHHVTTPINVVNLAWPNFNRINGTKDDERVKTSSCRTCTHFINSTDAGKELGVSSPICAARGQLLMPNKLTEIAHGCDHNQQRLPTDEVPTVGELKLLPEFEKGMTFSSFGDLPTDPLDYESDRPVTAEEAKRGIGAWRTIYDHTATRSLEIPIFRPDFFSENERSLIPRPGDIEKPDLYRDHGGLVYKIAVCWMKLDQTPALWGVPGTGKTELLRHMAYLMQLPFFRINVTGSMEVEELVGKMTYRANVGTEFQMGILPQRWTKPGVLCIDEPNVGPPDVWQVFRPLTDNSKQLVLTQNESENIPKNPDCYFGMAMNPAWHPLNVGTHQLGAADVSRIMHIHFDLPDDKLERQILNERIASFGRKIKASDLDTIMRIAKDLRRLSEEGTLPMTWGLREQIKVVLAWEFYDPNTVYQMCAADFLDPAQRAIVMQTVSANVR